MIDLGQVSKVMSFGQHFDTEVGAVIWAQGIAEHLGEADMHKTISINISLQLAKP